MNRTINTTSECGKTYESANEAAIRRTMIILQEVLEEGKKKYCEHIWLDMDYRLHIKHALNHIQDGLKSEHDTSSFTWEHMSHALCRMMMACITYERK